MVKVIHKISENFKEFFLTVKVIVKDSANIHHIAQKGLACDRKYYKIVPCHMHFMLEVIKTHLQTIH